MQIVCEKCGNTGAAAAIDVRGGAVWVTCSRCGHRSNLSAVDAPLASPAVAVSAAVAPPTLDVEVVNTVEVPARLPPVKCPKCGHRQEDPEACDRCGLVFANVANGRRPWEEWPAEQLPFVARAETLWRDVEARPTDPAAHAAFVDFCRKNSIIALAATRYRHRLADHPADMMARSYLDRIIRDASVMAQAMTVPGERFGESFKRVKNAVLIVFLVLSAVATAVLVRMSMSTLRGMP